MREPESVLGLSLGTSSIGVALYSSNEFMDWRVRNFRKGTLANRKKRILSYVNKITSRYGILHVAVKTPDKDYGTPIMSEIGQELRELLKIKNIAFAEYPLEELKLFLLGHSDTTKKNIIESLTERFPELGVDYERAMKGLANPYEKIYEAVAAILLYKHECR